MVMMTTCLVMVQTVLLQFLLQSMNKSLPCFVLFCTGYASELRTSVEISSVRIH